MHRSTVLLPEPLGPTMTTTSPLRDAQVHAPDRDDVTEALVEVLEDDHLVARCRACTLVSHRQPRSSSPRRRRYHDSASERRIVIDRYRPSRIGYVALKSKLEPA